MKKPFQPRTPRRFLGSYRPRVDGLEKARGQARYADDLTTRRQFPGLLVAKILHSPYPHARIRRLDTSKAERLPGVHTILTFRDPEVAKLKPMNAGWTDGVDTVSYDKMMWGKFKDRRVLDDTVRWVGDEAGVVVAAESEAQAEAALRALDIEWEELPFVLDPLQAMQPGAPLLHPEVSANNVLPADPIGGGDVFVDKGNVESGFAEADEVVEATSVYHNATQNSLDAWCCLSEWQGDKLTIWCNSYEADQTRMFVSQMLELPVHKVRVKCPFVGGQFGRGDTGDQPFFLLTALLAKKTGRPVKFRHTRRESFLNSRQPAIYKSRWGAKRDGRITAMTFEAIGNVGAYADHSMFALKFAPAEITEVALAHIPHVRMQAYGVYTNKLPACMMRGVGNSQFNLILGHMVDVLAERLAIDPLELVLKNFGHEWQSLPDPSLRAVLSAGAERIGWREKRHTPGQGPIGPDGKKRGVGFSFHPGWHAEWQEVRRGTIQVGLTLHPDGSVRLDAPTVETGPGSNTCNLLGCAEALGFLGVRPEDIGWVDGADTDLSLKDTVQTDSAVSFLQSEALVVAAEELRKKLLERAAGHLRVTPAEVRVAAGNLYLRSNPNQPVMTVKELLAKGEQVPLSVWLSRPPAPQKTGIPYMAAFAEVEVDPGLGTTEVLQLVIVNDCGTVMYASGAEAQQIGGQVMALGETLTEEIIYDPRTGVPLNFNWIDYQIPTVLDFPPVDPVLLEVWRGAGAYGACGIGEGVLTCPPRAILNAITQAIGVRIDDIPIKPEKVLRALGKV